MRSAEAVSMELGRMIARNYPEMHVNCGSCGKAIEEAAPCVILVTVARNPKQAGPAGRGQDFVGYDAALCSGECLRKWAVGVTDGDAPKARPVGCNRHTVCADKPRGSDCCFDECCEDCFGK